MSDLPPELKGAAAYAFVKTASDTHTGLGDTLLDGAGNFADGVLLATTVSAGWKHRTNVFWYGIPAFVGSLGLIACYGHLRPSFGVEFFCGLFMFGLGPILCSLYTPNLFRGRIRPYKGMFVMAEIAEKENTMRAAYGMLCMMSAFTFLWAFLIGVVASNGMAVLKDKTEIEIAVETNYPRPLIEFGGLFCALPVGFLSMLIFYWNDGSNNVLVNLFAILWLYVMPVVFYVFARAAMTFDSANITAFVFGEHKFANAEGVEVTCPEGWYEEKADFLDVETETAWTKPSQAVVKT